MDDVVECLDGVGPAAESIGRDKRLVAREGPAEPEDVWRAEVVPGAAIGIVATSRTVSPRQTGNMPAIMTRAL